MGAKFLIAVMSVLVFAVGFYTCEKDPASSEDENTVTDIDGNKYETVKIGDQWWMAENLKVTHYRNGDPIPHVTDGTEWSNLSSGAYCEYGNNSANVATYGRLYNWYAVDDSRGLAPEGWHVPTDAEWTELENYLGSDTGSQLAGRADLWEDGGLENNAEFGISGFNALPAGYRNSNGTFYRMGSYAYFWSSSEYNSKSAWFRGMYYFYSGVYRGNSYKQNGFSVHCVRD